LGITANGQGFAAGVELVFRPPTTAADWKTEVEVKN
jgi:hypothetical protein